MKQVFQWLDRHMEEVLMCVFLAGIVVFMSVHVFFRYILKSPLTWTEELTRYLFIWFVFSGFSYGIRNGSHIRVNILETLYPRVIPVFGWIQDAVTLVFIVYLIPAGISSMRYFMTRSQPSPGLHLPMVFVYGSLMLGLVASALRMVQRLYHKITRRGKEAGTS